MNCSAWVTRNIGRMTKSIFRRSLCNYKVELAGATHKLSKSLVQLSANLSLRGLQVYGFEILSVPNSIALVHNVHLLCLSLSRGETSVAGRLVGGLRHR